MEWSTIDLEIRDATAVIRLNREGRLNAFTVEMMSELVAAFDFTDESDEIRAVVLTGAGKAFCAGADLSAGADTFNYDTYSGRGRTEVQRDGGGILTLRMFRSKKPIIAAINGAAVGIGATMTLPCDIRLASEHAKFGFVFAARGIVPEACSTWFLPRVVGINRALEWVYTARMVNCHEAKAAGLVSEVLPAEGLLERACEIADDIAQSGAPLSVVMARMMMWQMLGASHPMEAHQLESAAMQELGRSVDAAEGVMSFFEKREPRWSMSVNEDLPSWYPWHPEPPFPRG